MKHDHLPSELGPLPERTAYWQNVLRGVTRERLGRECRALLVTHNVREAAARATSLFAQARNDAEYEQNCIFLAHALSELHRDRQQVQAMVEVLNRANPAPADLPLFLRHLIKAIEEYGASQFESSNQIWLRQQIEAVSALLSFLPSANESGEPDPHTVSRFYDELQALVYAGMADGRPDDLIDALIILSEYCPADPQMIQNLAGAEDRMFSRLGPTACSVCVRALARLGEQPTLRQAILTLARSPQGAGQDRLKLLTTVIGGLRHEEFFGFMRAALEATKIEREEGWILDALSRLSTPPIAELMLARLRLAIKKSLDQANERRAYQLLNALSRLCRLGRDRGIDPARRNAIIREVVGIVGKTDRRMTGRAADLFFTVRLNEVDGDLKAWAARWSVEALWGQPPVDRPSARQSPHGWRQPMVDTLTRLGSGALPTIIEATGKLATRYSVGMEALAGALQTIGDERAVGLLETMLRTAMQHREDPRASKLQEEKVRDPATGRLRDFDQDDLAHTLIYTLLKVGGEAGLNVVLDQADQVQAGRLTPPGSQTAAILMDTKIQHGGMNQVTRQAENSELSPGQLKKAMAEARGGLLTRRPTRIAALATLGQARDPEAIGVLVECLGDKDPLVAGAAQTALGRYMHPLPREKEFGRFLEELLDKPANIKGRVLEKLLEFIKREMPKNPPYSTLFQRAVDIAIEDEALARLIKGMALNIDDFVAEQTRNSGAPRPGSDEAAGEDAPGSPATAGRAPTASEGPPSVRAGGSLIDLDHRRAYMQARRAWIAGGKNGPPPEPPK